MTSRASAGMVLGQRYRLISPIASGGMAQVWRAEDLSLSRAVAIKILHPHLATDDAFIARFRREAVAAARLSHRSIVAVYDTLDDQGIEAIVMELIEGRTLRSVLDEAGLLAPASVIDVGIQISEALDAAHRAGIVHRDIKPANIMVGDDERILVTDFGIAKAPQDADLTHTGTLLGTAKYLAPEQVTGDPVDTRADIYALGVVLFEAATGGPPFTADTDAAIALARLQGEVPRCRHRRADVPVGLDEAIARAMAREPQNRFTDAIALGRALAAVDLRDVRPVDAQPGPISGPTTIATTSTSTNSPTARPQAPPRAPTATGRPGPPPPKVLPPPNPRAADNGLGTAVLPQPTGAQDATAKPGRKQRRQDKKQGRKADKAKRKAAVTPSAGGRQRPTKTIVAGLIVGGLLVSGLLVGSLLQPDEASGTPPVVADIETFDPLGDGTERAELAADAVDGDVETFWRTDTYNRAGLGGLKGGVGLILTLEETSSLDRIELITANSGWDMEIYVGGDFDPQNLGEPAGRVSDGVDTAAVDLGGATGSKVLLWVTETGLAKNGLGRDVFRFILFEATVS